MTEILSHDSNVVAFMAQCHNLCGYVAFKVNENIREADPEFFERIAEGDWCLNYCLYNRLCFINEPTYCSYASDFQDLENRAIPIVGDVSDIEDDWLIVGFDNDHTRTLTNPEMVDCARQMYNEVVSVRNIGECLPSED